jgi:hypothetical protein
MSKLYVVAGCMLLAFSAYAAEPQVKPAKEAKAVHAVKVRQAKWVDEGDSRLNDYRLERESCCGPQ